MTTADYKIFDAYINFQWIKQNVEGPAFELSDTQIVFLKNYEPADNKKAYKITEHAKSIYNFFKYFIYS